MRAILFRVHSKVANVVLEEAVHVAEKHQENDASVEVMRAASALRGELALKMNQLSNDFISGMICLFIF